jgi:hypothetical protein
VFLTDLDSRAAVKGSRDPLGLVPLWSEFGRRVVGNVTTVSGSVRGFTTTMLGYHFARVVRDREGSGAESTLALFLKFEQLAAYCRFQVAKDGAFRGIERVKKALAEGTSVRLSAQPEDQILSSQKVYGLWGLFSVPSRASGLLDRNETVLTALAEEFVEREYLTKLSKDGFRDGKDIADLLQRERPEVHLEGKHRSLAEAIARLHARKLSAAEREFYRETLAYGGATGETQGCQRQLAELMDNLPRDTPFSRQELRAVIKDAARRGEDWSALASRLRRIDHLEAVLAPAGALFGLLQASHSRSLRSVAKDLSEEWRPLSWIDVGAFRELQAELGEASHEPTAGERWVKIAEALASGQYDKVLTLLVEHNAFVMGTRSGSQPWVRVTGGTLDVRFRDDVSKPPARRELPDLWVNNYFLNPLKDIVMALAA